MHHGLAKKNFFAKFNFGQMGLLFEAFQHLVINYKRLVKRGKNILSLSCGDENLTRGCAIGVLRGSTRSTFRSRELVHRENFLAFWRDKWHLMDVRAKSAPMHARKFVPTKSDFEWQTAARRRPTDRPNSSPSERPSVRQSVTHESVSHFYARKEEREKTHSKTDARHKTNKFLIQFSAVPNKRKRTKPTTDKSVSFPFSFIFMPSVK